MALLRGWINKQVARLAATPFVSHAINEQADLSAFKERPSWRVIAGVGAIAFSYIIGWPLIGGLGAAAAYYKQPLLVAIGGPAAYGLSHLVFILGMYLAGAKYSMIFMRWAVRVTVLKMKNHFSPESGRSL